MSTTASVVPGPAAAPPFPVRRFTVAEYHRMIESGVLEEDDPVELLEGWIVPKTPRSPRHDATIDLVRLALGARLPSDLWVRVQSAITSLDSEPEPDLAVVRGPADRYVDHHPGANEILLLVEVAESSLERDRAEKARMYARAGIVALWVVNLIQRQVEAFTAPAAAGYREHRAFGVDETVPLAIDRIALGAIPVRELLPR